MCAPPAIAAAATVVSMGGQFISGMSAASQARSQAVYADRNAALSEEQARTSIENTNIEAQRRYRDASQLEGRQTAAMAANGIDLSFGSALDVQRDSKMIASEDVGQIYQGGYQRTRGFEIDASNYRGEAAAQRNRAKGIMIGTAFQMASTALGGASQIGGMNAKARVGG